MDDRMTQGSMRLPVTVALACALEDTGNLFDMAQALCSDARIDPALRPLAQLMCDIIAPLLDMGAIYVDDAGHKRIDRQALCDFGIVACGLPRAVVLYELSLHQLSLYHRKLTPRTGLSTPQPSADFMAQMQALFPDYTEDKTNEHTSPGR